MAPSDAAQRIYLKSRRQLLTDRLARAKNAALNQRLRAAELFEERAPDDQVQHYQKQALFANELCSKYTIALRAINGELGEGDEW